MVAKRGDSDKNIKMRLELEGKRRRSLQERGGAHRFSEGASQGEHQENESSSEGRNG